MRLRFPIKIVIPAVFLIIALVVAAFELMDIPEALENAEEHAMSSDVVFRMNRLEMTVERLIANGDIVGVQKEISAFGADADIKWLVFVDYNDRIVASTRIETVGAGIKETLERFIKMEWAEFSERAAEARKIYAGKAYIDKKERLINGFYPVYFNIASSGLRPALRGLLFIQYDYSAIRAAELHRSMMKISRDGAFIGGVMVLTWLFLYFALVRRARRLVKATERFAAGELDARTMMEGSDELGAIGRAFDGMAGSIAAYQSHLRENEELLKQSEARFRNLVESTNDWVWELDADLRYIYSNPKGSGLLGYAPSELLGRRFIDFMPVEERARFLEFFRPLAASKGPFFQFEHAKLARDGRSLIFESTGVPVFDSAGALIGYRGIGRDVTERKRNESVWRARLMIVEFSGAHVTDEILQLTLDELEKLTGSSIGFYHFLEADQNTLSLQNWSTNTLKTMCTAEGKGRHYNIVDAGVWVDCVHERRAVIHNDYASLPHRKGMPAGHAPVTRELVVPIFRGDKIVAIIGVGNKMQDYDKADISMVSQIGDVSWDIVERKRAEEALRASESMLKDAQRIAHLGGWEWDALTNRITWSDELFRIFNRDPGLPMPTYEEHLLLYAPESRSRLDAAVKKTMQTGEPYELDLEQASTDGQRRWLVARGNVVCDASGKVVGLRGIAQDITERKRAEEELHEANAYNRSLIEASLDPLVTIGPDGKITDVNAATEAVTGQPRDKLIGTDFADYFAAPDMARAGYQQVFRESRVSDYYLEIRRGDGNTVPVLYNASVYKNEEGKVIGVFAAARDITERKRAEEAVKLYQGHLEELVRVRTAELEAANIRLKELDRLKSMFIASMSHELRTPLNTIIGFVGIILQGMTGKISAEQRKQLMMVQDSSHHLLDLINDVIDVSKIEAGKVDLSIGSFDLSALVMKTAEPFAAQVGAKGVKFGISVPGEFFIESDARRIRQVLVNIFGNAVKFTDSGSIDVKMAEEDGMVRISITDTGIGISGGDMGRLFESFSQIAVNGRPKEGSGLGLYLTRKIMDLLGGEIKAESVMGKGSVFTVILPVKYERR